MIKSRLHRKALAAAIFLAFGASNPALAVNEVEAIGTMGVNDALTSAQGLVIDRDGKAQVSGSIGLDTAGPAIPDVDFFSFEGTQNDCVTIDIDGGMKRPGRSVDTIVAIFESQPPFEILSQVNNDDRILFPPYPDEGTVIGGGRDARIMEPPICLPATGKYFVGVSSFPRIFLDGGGVASNDVSSPLASFPNGTYTLTISGVTPPALVQYINIRVKPASADNPKARGTIPVVLLSSVASATAPALDAQHVKVDPDALTFGSTGDEKSLIRCAKADADVNGDGLPDLQCHFDRQKAEFQAEDRDGIVKGKTVDGRQFMGRGHLKLKHKDND